MGILTLTRVTDRRLPVLHKLAERLKQLTEAITSILPSSISAATMVAHAVWPEQKLAYNLSPSFNWKAAMEASEQETYIKRLASLGYCWQFITLAGLHSTALISNAFSKDYAKRGL